MRAEAHAGTGVGFRRAHCIFRVGECGGGWLWVVREGILKGGNLYVVKVKEFWNFGILGLGLAWQKISQVRVPTV